MKSWRRNVYIVCAAQFLTALGFTIVIPFLPLFVQELPVVTGGSPTLWIGFIVAGHPLTMIFISPIWGMVGDRYGRKLMILRATILGGLVIIAMAAAQSVEQLFLLRLVQGLTTGVVSATKAYISTHVPRRHLGEALGWISMALWLGVAGGPVFGGVLSDWAGFRTSFWLNGMLMIGAGLLVLILLREENRPDARTRGRISLTDLTALFGESHVRRLYGMTFLVHLAASFTLPVAALYVAQLNLTVAGLALPVATATGVMFGLHAVTGAAGSVYMGRLSDRMGTNAILALCAAVAALTFLPQAFVTHIWQLTLLQGLAGLAVGGVYPAASALLSDISFGGRQGTLFGLENSIRAIARALAPAFSAALAVILGLRVAYLATAGVYLGVALLVWLVLGLQSSQPPASDSQA